MNNAGTVLLTLADMSVIQAEVEVDETNIPHVSARPAGEDHDRRAARPDVQRATSPRSATARFRRRRRRPDARRRRTSRWSSCIDERDPGRAARLHVHGRHHHGDAQGRRRGADSGGGRPRAGLRRQRPDREGAARPTSAGARAGRDRRRRRRSSSRARRARKPKACSSCATAAPSSCRSRWASPATSTSRCCRGLKAGDQVITGPYNSVRGMADGDAVKVDSSPRGQVEQTAGEPARPVPAIMNKFLESARHRARRRSGRPSCDRS